MLPYAAEDGPGNFRSGRLGFCASLDFQHPGVDSLEGAPILGKRRQARCAHEARQLLLHRGGNLVAVVASKAVQYKFLDVDLDPVTSDG